MTDEIKNCDACIHNIHPLKIADFCSITKENPAKLNQAVYYNGSIHVALKGGVHSTPTSHSAKDEWYGGMCSDEYIAWMNTQITEGTLKANGDLVLTNNRGIDNPPIRLPFIKSFRTNAAGDVIAVRMDGTEFPVHSDRFVVRYENRKVGAITSTFAIMSDGTEQLVHDHPDDKYVASYATDADGNVVAHMKDGSTIPVLTFPDDNYVVSGTRMADNSIAVTMSNGSVVNILPAITNNVVSAVRTAGNLIITMKDGAVYTVPFTVDTDTNIDVTDLAISGNTVTLTESNGDTHSFDLPAAAASIDVSDFTLTGNELTITESNGDTHAITLPASASDVHVTGQTFDGATGAFVTTLTDGTTITTNFGVGGADSNTYLDGVTGTFQFGDIDTTRHYSRNDQPTIDYNEEYLLPKYIDPVIIGDKNTVTADYGAGVWEAYSVHAWTHGDLIALGMRSSDTAVILQLACSSLASDDEQAQVYTGFVVHGKWERKLKVNTMKLGTDHSGDTDQIVLNDAYVLDASGGITVDFTSFVRNMEAGGAQSTWRLDIVGFQRIVT